MCIMTTIKEDLSSFSMDYFSTFPIALCRSLFSHAW